MKKLSIGEPKKKQASKQSQNTQKREKGAIADLNFKVDAEFKRDFKMYATAHDMSQKQVLEMAFSLLKKQSL